MATKHRLDGNRRKRIRLKLIAMQGNRCCYCAEEFTQFGDGYATIEHVENRASGGANAQTNLAMACYGCNQRANREQWSPAFKRARIMAMNVVSLADLEVEHMELPPEYLRQAMAGVGHG